MCRFFSIAVSILPRLATGIVRQRSSGCPRLVSILPRLATGIADWKIYRSYDFVSILPRLATGIYSTSTTCTVLLFLFFPVLRRGSVEYTFPVRWSGFYSSPSCDGDLVFDYRTSGKQFLFFPVLRRGSCAGICF